ncbi:MAG: choice-of-anchor D domain-containing protein [Nitrospirota bacterium]
MDKIKRFWKYWQGLFGGLRGQDRSRDKGKKVAIWALTFLVLALGSIIILPSLAIGQSLEWQWPRDNAYINCNDYSIRDDACPPGTTDKRHTGIDVHEYSSGTTVNGPVYAVATGEVVGIFRPTTETSNLCPADYAFGCVRAYTNYSYPHSDSFSRVFNGEIIKSHGMQGVVIIRHSLPAGGSIYNNGVIYSLYAHLDSVSDSLSLGQNISRGMQVGNSGGGGYKHVHLEIKNQPYRHNPTGGNACSYSGDYGPCWGYVPGSPNDYGYWEPWIFIHTISNISPTTGSAGSEVALNGSIFNNLSDAANAKVYFGRAQATILSYNDSQIKSTAPAGNGNVHVRLVPTKFFQYQYLVPGVKNWITFSYTEAFNADLNHDGFVNAIDFAILLHYWGSTSKPVADINQDGIVNSVDFGIMMSNWYNPLPITGQSLTSEVINTTTLNAQVQGSASPQENQAILWLYPNAGSYQVGESFNVDILMNTGGQNAVVASAYIKYDPAYFRANSIDTTDSVFTMEPEKIIDSTFGIVGITRGIITPGVNTSNGKIATVNLTALSPISPETNNVTFLFTPGSTIGSVVCKDDGLGTNILSEVYNARFNVGVLYIEPSGLCGGNSPCYSTIQNGIDAAGPGATIKVAQGTYYENIIISTSKEFTLQGGWDSTFTSRAEDPSLTIIDGDVTGDGIGDGSVLTIIAVSGFNITVNIEGFTIQNGTGIVGQYGTYGGGIYAASYSSGAIALTLINNIISTNNATNYGGGLGIFSKDPGSSITVTLTNNIIAGNIANDNGGGIYAHSEDSGNTTLTLSNNTITDNTAVNNGGGLQAYSYNGGATDITLSNNIIWGNTASNSGDVSIIGEGGTTTINSSYNDIGSIYNDLTYPGVYYDLGGNINTDPLFENPASGDYHLDDYSPCIDTGTDDEAPSIDFEGDPRPFDGDSNATATTDIGADEYAGTMECTYTLTPASQTFPFSGGTGSVEVKARSSCDWTAASKATWIMITSSSNGKGNGTASYTVSANTSTKQRTGTINIQGKTFTVIQSGKPIISVSPKSVNFGKARVGDEPARIVTIRNTGLSDLEISSIDITGINPSEFSQTNDCTVIPTGGTCTITVKFTPEIPFGKKSAMMSISSNDPKKPLINVKLMGEAAPPKISASPRSVNFGNVSVGQTSVAKTVTIKNTGISDLEISSIDITGINPSEFSQTNDCTVIPKGSTCTITATFTPASSGKKSAIMSISSNDPKKSVVNVKLAGAGI